MCLHNILGRSKTCSMDQHIQEQILLGFLDTNHVFLYMSRHPKRRNVFIYSSLTSVLIYTKRWAWALFCSRMVPWQLGSMPLNHIQIKTCKQIWFTLRIHNKQIHVYRWSMLYRHPYTCRMDIMSSRRSRGIWDSLHLIIVHMSNLCRTILSSLGIIWPPEE